MSSSYKIHIQKGSDATAQVHFEKVENENTSLKAELNRVHVENGLLEEKNEAYKNEIAQMKSEIKEKAYVYKGAVNVKTETCFRISRAGFCKDESGAVMVIAAFSLIVFLSVASLVTDFGLRYYQKSRLQNAMDAAALASVTSLPEKARAKTVTLEYVQKNGFLTDSVTVEFPEEGLIRVRDTYERQTLFSGLFSSDKMHIEAHAAAKYIKKNMSLDFDYLMYRGSETLFNLSGDIREVAGAIFANGNIRVSTNDAATIGTIVSAQGIVFSNNMTSTEIVEYASKQQMPDWDEMIMSIAPVAEKEQFTDPHPHLSSDSSYVYIYNENANLQPVTFNVGEFSSAWGMGVNVGGNVYVGGKASFSGNSTIGSELYTGGDLTLNSGSAVYSFGKVHCMGDFNSTTAWGAQVTINGTTYVYGRLTLGGDKNILKSNVFVWGNKYNNSDEVCLINGYMNLQGSVLNMWGIVYAPKGDISISTNGLHVYGSLVADTITCNIGSGFYIGKNDRTLPFDKTVRAAALME